MFSLNGSDESFTHTQPIHNEQKEHKMTTTAAQPITSAGYFGEFGGSFVPEPIQKLLDELETTFNASKDDPEFIA